MSVRVIRREEYGRSKWSGGETREIAIYPESAKYSDRNFIWRLSSATVEIEESSFTDFTGFKRIIMIIDGAMTLEHKNHGSAQLEPFWPHSFQGEWITKSFGKATDFNLIMKESCSGSLKAISLMGSDKFVISPCEEGYHHIYYLAKGEIEAEFNGGHYILSEGDSLCISTDFEKAYELKLYNRSEVEVKIIAASIKR